MFLKLKPADEDKDALLKLKIKKRDFRIRIRTFSFAERNILFELCLKTLRMLVRLSVTGFLFQKVRPL